MIDTDSRPAWGMVSIPACNADELARYRADGYEDFAETPTSAELGHVSHWLRAEIAPRPDEPVPDPLCYLLSRGWKPVAVSLVPGELIASVAMEKGAARASALIRLRP